MGKNFDKWQYGDFQTPLSLAEMVLNQLVEKHHLQPDVIVEPSCGKGAFVVAAAKKIPEARIFGIDINAQYIQQAKNNLEETNSLAHVSLIQGDFFDTDWNSVFPFKNTNLLIIGNPPWVTASELSAINSRNLPEKTNFKNSRGIEAITGSSNFDISEYMLLQYINWLRSTANEKSTIAVLCKTSVARKIFQSTIKLNENYKGYIYPIDAKKYFDASVEACLFVLSQSSGESFCNVYKSFDVASEDYKFGCCDGRVIRDIYAYEKWKNFSGNDSSYVWRSGVKHDCAKVMELSKYDGVLINGLGEEVQIEDVCLYPLLKSADIANGRTAEVRKYVIITQSFLGDDTKRIRQFAPAAWKYLEAHAKYFDKRSSVIYQGKPPFSMFGVGSYTFENWKVAISGLYKHLSFKLIAPYKGRPVVFDDTVYFLSFSSEKEARFIYEILNSPPALEFLDSLIFWDEKRPVTTKVLQTLNFRELAKTLGREREYSLFAGQSLQPQLELSFADPNATYSAVLNV